jgi:hypothetical protein
MNHALVAIWPVELLMITLVCSISGCSGGEPVTLQAIASSQATWKKAAVSDYELEWESTGLSTAHYMVEVRGGTVRSIQSVSADGARRAVKSGEPRYYGVDGLFLTIRDELAQLDQPRPFGQPKGTKAILRFSSDPTYGYPKSYRRDVIGLPASLAIDVLRFTPKN